MHSSPASARQCGRDKHQSANLDLNALTMVPVHGSTQYRYALHLTRGRDLDRPAVVVLLDSDAAGKAALVDLEKGYGDADILDPRVILPIDSVPLGFQQCIRDGGARTGGPRARLSRAARREALRAGRARPRIGCDRCERTPDRTHGRKDPASVRRRCGSRTGSERHAGPTPPNVGGRLSLPAH